MWKELNDAIAVNENLARELDMVATDWNATEHREELRMAAMYLRKAADALRFVRFSRTRSRLGPPCWEIIREGPE